MDTLPTSSNFDTQERLQVMRDRQTDPERRPSAWFCVAGACLFLIPSYGFPQSMGSVQVYLDLNQLSDYSSRDIGWITGLYSALTLLLGIQIGPIVDHHGVQVALPLSTFLMVPMFFMLAECDRYWQFMLCLGIFGGIGGAVASTVALSVVGKVFVRFRGLAIGIALSGSAVGGVVYPFLLREVLPKWGWKWSIQLIGFTTLALMTIGTLCFLPFMNPSRLSQSSVEANPEPPSSSAKGKAAVMNLAAFRSLPFSLIAFAFFILEFVTFGIFGIVPTLSHKLGLLVEMGYNLVAIINDASGFGRILSGWLGDRFGHFNVLFAGTCMAVIWFAAVFIPFAPYHVAALYTFSVLCGISVGVIATLTPTCMGKTCDAKDYGRFLGTLNFTVSFALLITIPIGGQMLDTFGVRALGGLYLAMVGIAAAAIIVARARLMRSHQKSCRF